MREWIVVGLLAVASSLIVAGVACWSTPIALIVAGVLLAVLAIGTVHDIDPTPKAPAEREAA